VDNLELLWGALLSERLSIPRGKFPEFSVVLLVPDTPDPFTLEQMLEVLLSKLGFSRVAVVLEPVCASLALPTASACVVDIGFVIFTSVLDHIDGISVSILHPLHQIH
jgi:hypothetical protein